MSSESTRPKIPVWLVIVIGLGLILFGYTTWPTPWAYHALERGSSKTPMRTHRLLGYTETLTQKGWIRAEEVDSATEGVDSATEGVDSATEEAPSNPANPDAPTLPPPTTALSDFTLDSAELLGLEFSYKYMLYGQFHFALYNGSQVDVEGFQVEIALRNGRHRIYDVEARISPRTSSSGSFTCNFTKEEMEGYRLTRVLFSQ